MVESDLEAPYSHYLLTAELSQEIDQNTIHQMKIDGFTLMEVAGSSAAKKILSSYDDLGHGICLCGKGNNAGDALVVARYLVQSGIQTTIVFMSGTDQLSADTATNLELLQEYSPKNYLTIVDNWEHFDAPATFDFIVDGLLGTGLDSNVRGNYEQAVSWANEQEASIFSMDIPTGLHANTGEIMGCAIQASHTFSFGGHKQGLYLQEGPEQSGIVEYCQLPFPNKYKDESATYLLDESWVEQPPVSPGKHKYASGILYIIAGSEGLTGAAILAAKSAWAEGLGAVILVCPRGTLPIYEQTLPSIIKKPVGSRDDFYFSEEHTKQVLQIVNEKDGAVLIGPGLGRNNSTITFVEQFLSQNKRQTVIDADGLWCLSQQENWKKPKQADWILTPHPGELAQLTGDRFETDYHRLTTVRAFSTNHNIVTLSKGMPGIIGTPNGKCYLTNYNTRYFSRAGNGDVLAGKIGSYLAFGITPDKCCAIGLLTGKQKLKNYLKQHQGLPEPTDFI